MTLLSLVNKLDINWAAEIPFQFDGCLLMKAGEEKRREKQDFR